MITHYFIIRMNFDRSTLVIVEQTPIRLIYDIVLKVDIAD